MALSDNKKRNLDNKYDPINLFLETQLMTGLKMKN